MGKRCLWAIEYRYGIKWIPLAGRTQSCRASARATVKGLRKRGERSPLRVVRYVPAS